MKASIASGTRKDSIQLLLLLVGPVDGAAQSSYAMLPCAIVVGG